MGWNLSKTLAVHSTLVSPKAMRTEPSACLVKARLMLTGRNWVGVRPLGRVTLALLMGCGPKDLQYLHDIEHDWLWQRFSPSLPRSWCGG